MNIPKVPATIKCDKVGRVTGAWTHSGVFLLSKVELIDVYSVHITLCSTL